jgi:predicted acylesterase/phospholipase RssA
MAEPDADIGDILEQYATDFRRAEPPTEPCDLIMQGGVASGVVYPLAIMEVAQKHQLRGIGGTSAGAIGAVVAAAAEYGRRHRTGEGYAQLAALSRDILDKGLGRFFQPTRGMRGPFDLLVGLQSRGIIGAIAYIGVNWPIYFIFGTSGFLNSGWLVAGSPTLWDQVPRTLADAWAIALEQNVLIGAFLIGLGLWSCRRMAGKHGFALDVVLVLLLLGGLSAAVFRFFLPDPPVLSDKLFFQMGIAALSALSAMAFLTFFLLWWDLSRLAWKRHRFGVCSGLSVDPRNGDGLMEWLHGHVQRACGLAHPLTFGDLEPLRREADAAMKAGRPYTPPVDTDDIELRMTVTDLGLRRPHTLPILPDDMRFVPAELREVLPDDVVDALLTASGYDPATSKQTLAYPLPEWHKLPVLFAVRMSLCYPVLFRMVPLYHKRDSAADGPHKTPRERPRVRTWYAPWRPKTPPEEPLTRSLFTDGGICSNFPIHFYDGLLPGWPTLAIALEPSPDPRTSDVRIDRSRTRPAPRPQPLSLGDALGSIFQTAGGWRDQVQTSLPGYRERVCVVSLSKKQGGFDFHMAREHIRGAMIRGMEAGRLLCNKPVPGKLPFDEREHRFRRFLVAYARLEETLGGLARNWLYGKVDGKTWPEFIRDYASSGSEPPCTRSPEFPQTAEPAKPDKIAAILRAVDAVAGLAPQLEDRAPLRTQYDVPEPPTNLRVTPRE